MYSPAESSDFRPVLTSISKEDLVTSGEVWGFKTAGVLFFSGGGGGVEAPVPLNTQAQINLQLDMIPRSGRRNPAPCWAFRLQVSEPR